MLPIVDFRQENACYAITTTVTFAKDQRLCGTGGTATTVLFAAARTQGLVLQRPGQGKASLSQWVQEAIVLGRAVLK